MDFPHGWFDFIFGKDALKKAAGTDTKPATPAPPANIDIGKMAQQQADVATAQKKQAQPEYDGDTYVMGQKKK